MTSAYERKLSQIEKRRRRKFFGLVLGVGVVAGGAWVWMGLAKEPLQPNSGPTASVQVAPPTAPPTAAAPTRSANAPTPVAPLPAAPTPAPDLPPKDRAATDMSAQEITQALEILLNQVRADAGLVPLSPSNILAKAALGHGEDMELRDFFDHVSPDGGTLEDRAKSAGYAYCALAENIARGQKTVAEVHEAWMNSPGHRANNLSPHVTEFAIVLVDDTWVLMFGAPC